MTTASDSTSPLGDVLRSHQVALLAMATLAELRESDTEGHILRVQNYVRVLAHRLRRHPQYAEQLSDGFITCLLACAAFYDLGSIGVPDRVLLKPGKLSADELAIMRTHPTQGRDALARAEKTLGVQTPLLTIAKEMAYCHHERWNGSGYPQGLRGSAIPLSARILAVADVYDALIASKVYRAGISHEEAVKVIEREREAHFDPDVVDAFLDVQAEFQAISQRHADTDADMMSKIEYMANAIAESASL